MHDLQSAKEKAQFKVIQPKVAESHSIGTQKRFENAKRLQIIFFQMCIDDSFQSPHLRKVSKLVEQLKRIFFLRCTHDYYQNIHPKIVRNNQIALEFFF